MAATGGWLGCCGCIDGAGAYLLVGGAPAGGALYGDEVRGTTCGVYGSGAPPCAAGGAYWLAAADGGRTGA